MKTYVLLLCVIIDITRGGLNKLKIRRFPDDFKFGASTAAFQIEGGWREDDKCLSIWDVATHKEPSPVKDGSTADESSDSYHLFKKDIEAAKDLHLDFYKFSISWSRILPNGFADKVNPLGVNYYNVLVDELLRENITPIATMYHWDLPQTLQDIGGWANPLIANWFVDYAKVLFDRLGSKIKYWITINDPKDICHGGYGSASKPPMLNMSGVAEYICAKNVLLAHAKTFHLYDEMYRKLQDGAVGIAINFVWYEPASETVDDHQAAIDARMFDWGIYANPIFSRGGDFPNEVKKNVATKSAEQGYPKSRLPDLNALEIALIRGSGDFLAVNSFTTTLVYRDASLEGMYPAPSYLDDIGTVFTKDTSWNKAASNWLQDVPWGFYKLLLEIKVLYDNPAVYVTANGWSTTGGLLDEARIVYLRGYLTALLDALDDGCNINGYSVWSLIDGFEWMKGYGEKFGLFEVDFISSEKTRTPRKSAFVYREIVRTRKLDISYEPEKFLVDVDSPPNSNEQQNEPEPEAL